MRVAGADRKQLGIKRDVLWDRLQSLWPVEHSYFYNILKGVRPSGYVELLRALARIFAQSHQPQDEQPDKEAEYLQKYHSAMINSVTSQKSRRTVDKVTILASALPNQVTHRNIDICVKDKCLPIGRTQTLWWRATGNGERGKEIRVPNISCTFHRGKRPLYPPELQAIIDDVRRDWKNGLYQFRNDSRPALEHLDVWPPAGPDEDRMLRVDCGETDYAAFYAIARHDDGRKIKDAILREWNPDNGPLFYLSPAVGVNVAIFTEDKKFLFGMRSPTQEMRRGEYDVGSVEGVSIKKDVERNNRFDLYAVARRGIWEEYRIAEVDIKELHILAFGYDLQYCSWNAIAVCYVNRPATAIRRRIKQVAIDHTEYADVIAKDDTPEAVFEFLRDKRFWSCGFATAFYTMVHRWGADRVLEATDNFQMADESQFDI